MLKTLLFVVDMQYDFVMPDGALYVPGAEALLVPTIKRIMESPRSDVVYTMDTHDPRTYADHREAKLGFPPHCLSGTRGREVVVPMRGADRLVKDEFDVWSYYPNQRYLEATMRSYDRVEVCGVAADYCVRYAVDGFKARGIDVFVNPALTVGIKENPFQ